MKKIIALALSAVMALSLAACASSAAPAAAPEAPAAPAAPAASEAKGSGSPVKITMWHSNSGTNGEALQQIADAFNAEQSDYEIELIYQGEYGDAFTKYKSTPAGSGPDMFMCQIEQMQYMIDSGTVIPLQGFIDRDNFDISDLSAGLVRSYTVNGQFYALPMGSSLVGCVYNADLFEQAGVDPALLKTWDGMFEAAEKLVESGVCKYGGAIAPGGFVMEFVAGMEGKDIVDNDNGHSGRATKAIVDETGIGEFFFDKVKRAGESPYFNTEFTSDGDYKSLLISGELGFLLRTSSYIGSFYKGAEGKYKVGFTNTPKSPEATGGQIAGGCSTWIIDNGDDARANGAWEFVKFCMREDMQLIWSIATGYVPLTNAATSSDEYKAYMAEVCPDLETAIAEFGESESSGALLGLFTKWRELVKAEQFNLYNNKDYTPAEATANFVKAVNEEIELYNLSN